MSSGLTHTYPNLIWKCFWVVSLREEILSTLFLLRGEGGRPLGVSKDASRVPFSCKRRGYKDIPRGPTLKVERSGRGLKSLFDQVVEWWRQGGTGFMYKQSRRKRGKEGGGKNEEGRGGRWRGRSWSSPAQISCGLRREENVKNCTINGQRRNNCLLGDYTSFSISGVA